MDSARKMNSLPTPRPHGAEMVESWLKHNGIVLQQLREAHIRALIQRNHPLAQALIFASKARQSKDPEEQIRLYKQADAIGLYEEEVFEVLCLFQMTADDAKKWRSQTRETIRKNAEDFMDKTSPFSMGHVGSYLGWLIVTIFEPSKKQS